MDTDGISFRVVLHLWSTSDDRVEGTIEHPDDDARSFSGWLELLAVLETILTAGA